MSESLYPRMVQEYYVARFRDCERRRDQELAAVSNRAEAVTLRQRVRRRLRRCFGPTPERTPLNAVTTGSIERQTYTIEKILYESRPGLKVSANLYVPHREGPFPAVLAPCGHSPMGKAEGLYQAFAGGLARRGYLVLIYDPLSQGEREQITEPVGDYRPGNCCHEHNMFGNRLALLDDFFGMWRSWDGIRGLDYLLGRPEADRSRVGVTGNSGGGTLSTYITGLDPRLTMAAPSCFVTTLRCNMENELPADSEQTPPRMLEQGLDQGDYFIAHAPRPLLLLGQRNDFFDVRGLRRIYEELRRIYSLLGAEENIEIFVGPRGHGYHEENREAMYRFFAKHANQPTDVDPSEGEPEPEQVLRATPEGSVLKAGSRNMSLFLQERADNLAKGRKELDDKALVAAIRKALALPPRKVAPHYRVVRGRPTDTESFDGHSLFAVETEPGILALLHLYGPEQLAYVPQRKAPTLYLPHLGAEAEVPAGLAPEAEEIYALDVRGMGLSEARTCACTDFFAPYGSDYMYAAAGQMLAEPYLGRRVHDLLCVLDLLAAHGAGGAHLAGRGLGAITTALAGCIHPLVTRVTLYNAPESYHEMMRHPVVQWPASSMAQGLLKHFDLPDCYALLRRTRKLQIIEPWDHLMQNG